MKKEPLAEKSLRPVVSRLKSVVTANARGLNRANTVKTRTEFYPWCVKQSFTNCFLCLETSTHPVHGCCVYSSWFQMLNPT